MFDKIIDVLENIWDSIVPYIIVLEYQEGVLLRFGKYKKVLTKGIHFKIPIIDTPIIEHIAVTTTTLPPQSLTTLDDKTIVVKGIIKYKITDIHKYALLIWDAKDALVDTTCGIIRDTVNEKNWEEIRLGKIDGLISRRVKSAAEEYGIEVIWVTLTDISIMKSFRLFSGNHIID